MADPHAPTLDCWPLWVRLESEPVVSRGWSSERWRVAEILTVDPQHPDAHLLPLQLYRDERIAYRFNLCSQSPTLFVLCEQTDAGLVPRRLSTCQDVAADAMDGNEPVLSIPLPPALRLWNERFMAHHGELDDPRAHRRRLRGGDRARTGSEVHG